MRILPLIALAGCLLLSGSRFGVCQTLVSQTLKLFQDPGRQPMANKAVAFSFRAYPSGRDTAVYGATDAAGMYRFQERILDNAYLNLMTLKADSVIVVKSLAAFIAQPTEWEVLPETLQSPPSISLWGDVYPLDDARYRRAYLFNSDYYVGNGYYTQSTHAAFGPASRVRWEALSSNGVYEAADTSSGSQAAIFDLPGENGSILIRVNVENAWLGGKIAVNESTYTLDTAHSCTLNPRFHAYGNDSLITVVAEDSAIGAQHSWRLFNLPVGFNSAAHWSFNPATTFGAGVGRALPIVHSVQVNGCTDAIAKFIYLDSLPAQVSLNGSIHAGTSLATQADSVLLELIGYDDTSYAARTVVGSQPAFSFGAHKSLRYLLYATPVSQSLRNAFMPTYYGHTLNWSASNLVSTPNEVLSGLDINLIPVTHVLPGQGMLTANLHGDGNRFQIQSVAATHTYRTRYTRLLIEDITGNPVAFARTDASGQIHFSQGFADGVYTVIPETPLLLGAPIRVALISGQTADLSFYLNANSLTGNRPRPAQAGLEMYPNPADGKVTIQVNGQPAAQICLINTLGQQTSILNPQNKTQLNLSLPPGLYQVQATDATGHTSAGKLVIE